MVAVLVALMIACPWLLELLTTYTTNVFRLVPTVVR
jgi:flagellar biosynthesis protein FliQ